MSVTTSVEMIKSYKPSLNPLGGTALLVVLIAAIPLGFVILSSWQLPTDRWLTLWSERLPRLIFNTLSLATLVALCSVVLGISSAWFIARREFPAKRLAIWLLLVPLTIPTYVLAHIYTSLRDENGWNGMAWHSLFGQSALVPDIYNIWGTTFVLSLAGFSYVFLLARSALGNSTQRSEEHTSELQSRLQLVCRLLLENKKHR